MIAAALCRKLGERLSILNEWTIGVYPRRNDEQTKSCPHRRLRCGQDFIISIQARIFLKNWLSAVSVSRRS